MGGFIFNLFLRRWWGGFFDEHYHGRSIEVTIAIGMLVTSFASILSVLNKAQVYLSRAQLLKKYKGS